MVHLVDTVYQTCVDAVYFGHLTFRGAASSTCSEDVHEQGSLMIRIGIVLGSTRPGRRGDQVARWVHERAARRGDAEFEVVDLRDHPLPHLADAPMAPGGYRHEHTRAWAAAVAAFDGFVIVTP